MSWDDRLVTVNEHEIRERVWAKLDAERPWWVLNFYEVGITVRVRAKALGEAIGRLQVGSYVVRIPEDPNRKLICPIKPPGRFTYRTEPFER